MRRTASIFMMILLALVFYSPAHAAPPRAEKKTEKERLVLMPLKADSVDKEMFGAMETAVVEGLRDRYTVYSGERVAKKAREIFAKESRAAKKECDAAMCMQDIAMAFQAELIAVVSVTKRPDGYFLALSIKNIVDDKEVDSRSLPCEGCNEYKVVEMLKTLAGGGTSALAGGAPAAPPPSKGKPAPVASPAVPSGDFSLDDLDGQAKAEEERKAAEKAKWDKYLTEMKKAFGKVESYEKRDISKELKVTAWEKFLKTYKDDDPFSGEDEDLRDKAKERVESLKNRSEAASSSEGMVLVKGGCFQMGDTFGDGFDNEKPVHTVCVNDFYMSKYDVTVGEFREFVKTTGYRSDAEKGGGCYYWAGSEWKKDSSKYWENPGFSQTDSNPVACVSWNDANGYISWKGRKDGQSYRLPTEAEWEYAARSGGKKEKWAGTSNESELGEYAWYSANSGDKTHPVGQKRSNGLGLYDMTGNVWQWTGDWYDENYYKNSPKDSPKGPSSGQYRVLRGGSWVNDSRHSRASFRNGGDPDVSSADVGFRFVRTK